MASALDHLEGDESLSFSSSEEEDDLERLSEPFVSDASLEGSFLQFGSDEKESLIAASERDTAPHTENPSPVTDAGSDAARERVPSPETSSNWFSRLTLEWSTPLIRRGYKEPLRTEDLYLLPLADDVPSISRRAQIAWNKNKNLGDSYIYLMKAVFGIDFPLFAFMGVAYLVWLLCNIAQSVIVANLIKYTSDADSPVWWGVCLAAFAFLTPTLRFFCEQNFYYYVERVGMRWRTAVMSLIYQKSLVVNKVSKGNANNLLNVDPSKIANICWSIHRVWAVPLQLIISTTLLYHWLGVSAFAADVIMALLIPLNYWMMNGFGKTQNFIMELKDERVKDITEVLQGISIVKLFSWEDFVFKKIEKVRSEEIRYLKKYAYLLALLMFLSLSIASFVSVGTFTVYALLGNTLSAEKIFPSLMLFENLVWPILMMPGMISKAAEAKASFVRVNKFLRRKEIQPLDPVKEGDAVISLTNAAFEWEEEEDISDEEEKTKEKKGKEKGKEKEEQEFAVNVIGDAPHILMEELEEEVEEQANGHQDEESQAESQKTNEPQFILRNIDLQIASGELVAVVGHVGAGKTSLLHAILGEMKRRQGTAAVSGRLSFIAQRAWIRNASLKDNILFGLPLDEDLYDEIGHTCALEADLRALPNGDQTEIGEQGVNLSGGQKQRVALARALYCNNDIYLLDDPLSAVDSNVGQHLFRHYILEALKAKGKTVVLVTHQLQYLPYVDRVLVMAHGQIQQTGTYQELLEGGFDFAEILKQQTKYEHQEGDEKKTSSNSAGEKEGEKEVAMLVDKESEDKKSEADKLKAGRLIDDEERVTGAVEWKVYGSYILSTGSWLFILFLLVVSISMELSSNFTRVWLALWSSDPDPDVTFYLSIYLSVALGASLMSFMRQFTWARGTLNCAKNMHDNLLQAILRAPMTFFFATPSGRIINRFSKDQGSVDQDIPDLMSDWFLCMFSTTSTLVVICLVMPWFILAFAPIGLVYYIVQNFYRKSSRELGRLMAITASPIYAQYSETLEGLETIRAFRHQQQLIEENEKLVEVNMASYLQWIVCNRWLGIRIETISAVCVLFLSGLAVATKGYLSVGLVGLMLTLAAQMNGDLNWVVRSGTSLESNMNRVERIEYYTQTPPEAPLFVPSSPAPRGWPSQGQIVFENVWMKYRDDLNPVLKGISCTLNPREKIGIVGRTGAGKSSFTSVLFRMIEPYAGTIKIDGVDISQLGLRELRQALTIIPQDPFLFSGTIRSNLDPFDNYEDHEVWQALQRVHMKDYVSKSPNKLDSVVMAGGSNLSVGQRQLLCMARALLKDTKILIMDEATASVDTETDGIIQRTVREEFNDRTVLTIAHRLETIMDSDRVLVMEKGEIAEFDAPAALLENPQGLFHALVEATGTQSARHLKSLTQRN